MSRHGAAGYSAATYGDAFADVYDDWYGDITDTAATARLVAQLCEQVVRERTGGGAAGASGGNPSSGVGGDEASAGAAGGRVLELGIGTGRLALAIAELEISVDGIEASQAMLDKLAAKPSDGRVSAVRADFGSAQFEQDLTIAPGPYEVVLVAYNTLFNLDSEPAQLRCLRAAAKRMHAGSKLVVEAFLPSTPSADQPPWPQVEVNQRAGSLVVSASVADPQKQMVRGQQIEIPLAPTDPTTADPTAVRVRPWQIRYLTPAQLDELARSSGLTLAHRWADWNRTAFDPAGSQHISVYELA